MTIFRFKGIRGQGDALRKLKNFSVDNLEIACLCRPVQSMGFSFQGHVDFIYLVLLLGDFFFFIFSNIYIYIFQF